MRKFYTMSGLGWAVIVGAIMAAITLSSGAGLIQAFFTFAVSGWAVMMFQLFVLWVTDKSP